LEHEHIPQVPGPVCLARKICFPLFANDGGSEYALLAKAAFLQQRLAPIAERTGEPAIQWDSKACLETLREAARNIAREHFSQYPLACVIPDLH
jgi:hypothetical protein